MFLNETNLQKCYNIINELNIVQTGAGIGAGLSINKYYRLKNKLMIELQRCEINKNPEVIEACKNAIYDKLEKLEDTVTSNTTWGAVKGGAIGAGLGLGAIGLGLGGLYLLNKAYPYKPPVIPGK